ncbi:hypothetical protein [Borreliella americana]|uniref:hypothetical protein n=1 Tax=Borreliella americana TaxID=478807 RepID=UPI001E4BCB41|nr:hypothetical protein [Borreliella americana]MCD2382032.1 hypothetical protein [Borreliella americana]
MNLMIKVLLISSLFLSFISCKLYKAIDKSQQALAIQDLANNKSLIKDNKRSGCKIRSISYKEVNNQEQNNEIIGKTILTIFKRSTFSFFLFSITF